MIKIENTEVMGWDAAVRGMRNPMNSWDRSDSGICKGGDNGIGCENCTDCGCDHAYDYSWKLGKNDHELMIKLAAGGSVHAKYRRMIAVYCDITAPLYWWKEFDTYKVGTVANSCSTMHKIADKEFTLEDFSCEHLRSGLPYKYKNGITLNLPGSDEALANTLDTLNRLRDIYLNGFESIDEFQIYIKPKSKEIWWQMIQLLPSSYNQKRTVMLNYEVLSHIYHDRKNHKLDEWCRHDPVIGIDTSGEGSYSNLGFCDWVERLPYFELITGAK